jgi:hypothetical protein
LVIFLSIYGILLAIYLSIETQELARSNWQGNLSCNYVSYLITPRCINLSHLEKFELETASNSLEYRFVRALAKLNIPVMYDRCEKDTTVGYYSLVKNKVVLCQDYKDEGYELLVETLAHESWHVVQDCLTGLKDSKLKAVSSKNHIVFDYIVNQLTVGDKNNLELYDSEALPYEIEAFVMEKHPDIVLKGLKVCTHNMVAKI